MSGSVIWMTIVMWIAATAAFAPLGYFIYKYAKDDGEGAKTQTDSE